MSKENACGTCEHFSPNGTQEHTGECRLQPPVAHIITVSTLQGAREMPAGIFPPVHATACWCSVWRPAGPAPQ
jgi:hypothetical protein